MARLQQARTLLKSKPAGLLISLGYKQDRGHCDYCPFRGCDGCAYQGGDQTITK